MQVDWWLQPKKLCSATPSSGICHRNKSQLNCMQHLCDWVKGRSISVSYIYIYIYLIPPDYPASIGYTNSFFSPWSHQSLHCLPHLALPYLHTWIHLFTFLFVLHLSLVVTHLHSFNHLLSLTLANFPLFLVILTFGILYLWLLSL